MGLMDKVKKILFDEDIVEVPVDSDELPERTPKKGKIDDKKDAGGFIDYHNEEEENEENPIKEIKVPAYEEKQESKEEEEISKFNFVDDSEFQDIPSRVKNYENLDLDFLTEDDSDKEIKNTQVNTTFDFNVDVAPKKEITDYRKMLSNEEGVTEKKPFQNTPVISPVWGILDKNYKPEEIVDRTEALTRVNTGAIPRSYGPVSYNDQPLIQKRYVNGKLVEKTKKEDKVEEKEETTLKEDLVELNNTISEMVNEDVNEMVPEETSEVEAEIEDTINENITVDVEVVPTHSIDDMDDDIIKTDNYDDYEDIQDELPKHKIDSILDGDNSQNNIEDAFESTGEFNSINERDSYQDTDEEEPMVDLEALIDKKDDESEDDAGLDDTIETDLFNLIDSMYKDDEDE